MEQRKIIKFGNSSYVITLPNNWLEENKLGKGDVVNIGYIDNTLLIKPIIKSVEKRAIIKLDGKPLKLFNKELISYYLKNYKYIEIIGKNILEKLDQIKVFQEKLSSVEIVELSEEKIVLKDLTSIESLNFDNLLNEIIDMVKLLFDNLIEVSINDNFDKKHFITTLDKNINKLAFLSYKSLNYSLDNIVDVERVKNSIHYWRLISSLEQIGDIIKRVARYLKCSNNECKIIQPILSEIKDYFNFITTLLDRNINLENNLEIYLDKKQSIFRGLENLRKEIKEDINNFLVVQQLLKDLIGQIDIIILSIIDIRK